jgi:hypothetical protein
MKIRKKLLRTTMIVAAALVSCFATPQAQAATKLLIRRAETAAQVPF